MNAITRLETASDSANDIRSAQMPLTCKARSRRDDNVSLDVSYPVRIDTDFENQRVINHLGYYVTRVVSRRSSGRRFGN